MRVPYFISQDMAVSFAFIAACKNDKSIDTISVGDFHNFARKLQNYINEINDPGCVNTHKLDDYLTSRWFKIIRMNGYDYIQRLVSINELKQKVAFLPFDDLLHIMNFIEKTKF